MQLKISTRIKFIFIFITIILAEYALVKYPLLTKQIIDNIENGKGKETIYLFVTLAGFIIFLNICLALQQLVKSKYLNDVKHYFKKYVFAGILRMETESITSKKQAEYISMFNNDIPMVCEDFYSTIFDVITSVIMLIFSLTALIQINIYLMLIIVACFILLALNPIFFKNCLQNKKKNISLTLKTFTQKLQDSISCIRIIKSYLASKETEQEIDEKSHIANEAKYQY
ncbi:MAG: ABC transporter transmembrane domain-containing protein, partial [Oscillospiraceae bacterium]